MTITPLELLEKEGAIHVKDVLSLELSKFFTYVLLRKSSYPNSSGDTQAPNSKAIISHEYMFETVLELIWPKLEIILGTELLPTYAYSRLYGNCDILEKHMDRPACEISMTIQLGRSHNYAWPIFMGNKRFDLAEGDSVVYKGCDIEHWRNVCDGPENYYSGQLFLHFVRKDGKYSNHACDPTTRESWPDMFVKHRPYLMDNK
jgi:hypothetical protein